MTSVDVDFHSRSPGVRPGRTVPAIYERFVSQSGRVVIETNSWNFVVIPPDSQLGTTITWRSRVRSLDSPTWDSCWIRSGNGSESLRFAGWGSRPGVDGRRSGAPSPPWRLRVHHPAGDARNGEGVGSAPDLRYLVTENQLLVTWPSSVSGPGPG